ncbi:pantothenate synthase [Tulasnella sp. 419]|nr:pantothenate synthase [Tulasnella sp. 419]
MTTLKTAIPVFNSLRSFREWRMRAFTDGKSVGFVPTMGALHDGHMSLVRHSLEQNDLTVVSIFVNPTQFAPHEDLSTYPRTLEADLALMSVISVPSGVDGASIRIPSAVFAPTSKEMYPSGAVQDVSDQKGAFVEIPGYGSKMEGKSRPTFFRGVATVVSKLFNAVQPTNAYFGQKDIQQALIVRRLTRDLLFANPTPENVHIVPTFRAEDGLALSSRNKYLSEAERAIAPVLFKALKEGEQAWQAGEGRDGAVQRAIGLVESTIESAKADGIEMRLDYIEMNDPEEFDVVNWDTKPGDGRPVILSGAIWIGRTRLIDNLLLGDWERQESLS